MKFSATQWFVMFSLVSSAMAQQAIQTTVCTFDLDDSSPLVAAEVKVQAAGSEAVENQTGANGCVTLAVPIAVSNEEQPDLPNRFIAGKPYPNPGSDRVTIPFEVDVAQAVQFQLYDLQGRSASGVFVLETPAGRHQVDVDLGNLASGVYAFRLQGSTGVRTGTLVKTGGPGSTRQPGVRLTSAPAGARPTLVRPASVSQVRFQASKEGYLTLATDVDVDDGETIDLFLQKQADPGENNAPVLPAFSDRMMEVGETLSIAVSATDPDGDALTLEAELSKSGSPNGPDTFTDNGDGTGQLSIQPQAGDEGVWTATVTASDGSLSAKASFSVTVTTGGIDGGMVPLIDMGVNTYKGFTGGLYPNASNQMPANHYAAGVNLANSIEPLDLNGNPSPTGKYVMVSIGMSNTTQEFCSQSTELPCDSWTFMGQAAADPEVNTSHLVIVNGAKGGEAADEWQSPDDKNYNRINNTKLIPQGLSEQQVQVVWVKVANRLPTVSLPDAGADAFVLQQELGNIVRALKARYPNLKQVFLTSRIYAGYAVTELNPEPYAYESGFSAKWLIEAQIDQMEGRGTDAVSGDMDYNGAAAWTAWAAYPWADGTNPRSDGLIWERQDLESDGTHPSRFGEEKVGALLMDFFKNSPQTKCWFLENGTCE